MNLGSIFQWFREPFGLIFSDLLASFFDTFQALIFGWFFDVIFKRFWSKMCPREKIPRCIFFDIFQFFGRPRFRHRFWRHFCMILEPFWLHFRAMLGSFSKCLTSFGASQFRYYFLQVSAQFSKFFIVILRPFSHNLAHVMHPFLRLNLKWFI